MQEQMRDAVQNMRYGERNPEMQIGLAKIYESQGRMDLMWRLCLELKKMGYSDLLKDANLPTTRPADLSIRDEMVPLPIAFARVRTRRIRKNRPKKPHSSFNIFQRKQEEAIRDQVIRTMYDSMVSLKEPIANGDINARPEWMRIAGEIFEEFRSYPKFFPADRTKPFAGSSKGKYAVMPDLTEPTLPEQLEFEKTTSWREIGLDDLVDMILQYAIFLADDGEEERAFDILKTLEISNLAWSDAERRYLVWVISLRK
jgi:general transcription factor 3C polypeptide 3 (transcription factor C subunit 4)